MDTTPACTSDGEDAPLLPWHLYNRNNPPGQRLDTVLDSVPIRARDLTGFKNGFLEILGIQGATCFPNGTRVMRWRAQCRCGNTVVVNGAQFLLGRVRSCGCLGHSEKSKRHGKPPASRKPLEIPAAIKFMPEDLKRYKHTYPDLVGRTFGALVVEELLYAMLYRSRKLPLPPRNTGRKLPPREKKATGMQRSMLTFFMCRCTCGNRVRRHSTYLSRNV